MIAWLLARSWGPRLLKWGAIGLAVALFVFGLRRRGEQAGRLAERAEQLERTVRNVEIRRTIEDEVRRAGDGTASAVDRLRERWSRD